eukprot:tig00000042_g15437.t1
MNLGRRGAQDKSESGPSAPSRSLPGLALATVSNGRTNEPSLIMSSPPEHDSSEQRSGEYQTYTCSRPSLADC